MCSCLRWGASYNLALLHVSQVLDLGKWVMRWFGGIPSISLSASSLLISSGSSPLSPLTPAAGAGPSVGSGLMGATGSTTMTPDYPPPLEHREVDRQHSRKLRPACHKCIQWTSEKLVHYVQHDLPKALAHQPYSQIECLEESTLEGTDPTTRTYNPPGTTDQLTTPRDIAGVDRHYSFAQILGTKTLWWRFRP